MAFLIASTTPLAHAEDASVVSHFNNSMVRLYVASEMCREVSDQSQEYKTIITAYLNGEYPNGIPYWVLPKVKSRIASQQRCNAVLLDRAITYQVASRDYADAFPDENSPPNIRAYVIVPVNEEPSSYRSLNVVRRSLR